MTRSVAVQLAGLLGDDAERVVRSLLDTGARGQALAWLAEQGRLEAGEIEPRELLLAALESLSFSCTGEPQDDAEAMPILVGIAEMVPTDELMDALWHVGEPWAGDVLAAFGRLHPDKQVGKAARKALMQHRTRMADTRRRQR